MYGVESFRPGISPPEAYPITQWFESRREALVVAERGDRYMYEYPYTSPYADCSPPRPSHVVSKIFKEATQ